MSKVQRSYVTLISFFVEILHIRDHFSPGQGCYREVAAYIFDVDNFCGVPPTVLVYCEHSVFNYNSRSGRGAPKVGSLQVYVDSYSDLDGIGSSLISDFEIQKIALLDLRILNCDRNSANILVRHKLPIQRGVEECGEEDEGITCSPGTSGFLDLDVDIDNHGATRSDWELIPIDHGYSMPTRLKVSEMDWDWFNQPALKKPVLI